MKNVALTVVALTHTQRLTWMDQVCVGPGKDLWGCGEQWLNKRMKYRTIRISEVDAVL